MTKGRTIVLPISAAYYLLRLANSIRKNRHLPGPERLAIPSIASQLEDKSSRIFINSKGRPFRPKAVSKMWAEVVKRAGLEPYKDQNLRFHDLRTAANDRFIRANLEPEERDIMMGHNINTMNDTYTSDNALDYILGKVQQKLDRYTLGEDLEGAYSTEVEEGMILEKFSFINGNPYLPSEQQKEGFKQDELKLALARAINLFVLKQQIDPDLWDDILSYLKDKPGSTAPDIALLR